MIRFIAMVLLLVSSACSSPSDVHETRFIMGTLVEFTVAASDHEKAEVAIAAAAIEMQRIEDDFTIYGEHPNAVKAFNASKPGTVVSLPDEVAALLQLALEIKQQSDGAFDPALGRLNLLWGFSGTELPSAPPDPKQIAEAIPPARCIEKSESGWRRLDERCLLDFGAIAKGYAIDRGIEIFRRHGIHNAIINAGGDIRLIGSHGERPWRIGIRHPRNQGDVLETMELQGDISIVTSGDYERFFMFEGKRYHHIIDPETGRPGTRAQSATVMARSAVMADAWSTALFIQGLNEGVSGIKQQTLLVDHSGLIHGHLGDAP